MTVPVLLSLWIPGPPVPKGRPRFMNGHAYTPKRTREYEEQIGWLWREQHPGAPTTARVAVNIAVQEGPAHAADLDNFVKVILDALNGIAYVDDVQVERITASITRGSTEPGIAVTVEQLEGAA